MSKFALLYVATKFCMSVLTHNLQVYQDGKKLPTSFDSFGHCIARLLRVTSLTCPTHAIRTFDITQYHHCRLFQIHVACISAPSQTPKHFQEG